MALFESYLKPQEAARAVAQATLEKNDNSETPPEMKKLAEELQAFVDEVGEDAAIAFLLNGGTKLHSEMRRGLANLRPWFPDNDLGQRMHRLADTFDGFTTDLGIDHGDA
jgi:hypothetical protein